MPVLNNKKGERAKATAISRINFGQLDLVSIRNNIRFGVAGAIKLINNNYRTIGRSSVATASDPLTEVIIHVPIPELDCVHQVYRAFISHLRISRRVEAACNTNKRINRPINSAAIDLYTYLNGCTLEFLRHLLR